LTVAIRLKNCECVEFFWFSLKTHPLRIIQMHSEKGKEQNLSKAMDDRLLKVPLSQRGI